jgi:hypothetical protein
MGGRTDKAECGEGFKESIGKWRAGETPAGAGGQVSVGIKRRGKRLLSGRRVPL